MKRALILLIGGLLFLWVAPQEGMADSSHRARQTRPIQLGTSGGNIDDRSGLFCCSGTLGALVSNGSVFQILSNSHVFSPSNGGVIGADINQPGNIDVRCRIFPADIVADLADFQPTSFSSDNIIDAAVATIRDGQVRTDGVILDIGQPASTHVDASIGMAVKKSGRTSGLTRGTIAAIAVTVNVASPVECGSRDTQVARYVNQMRIRGTSSSSRFSKSGDSGSLIVEDKDSCPRPVGLLFAGGGQNTFANPIGAVLSAFGVSIVGCPASAAQGRELTEDTWVSRGEVAAALAVQQRHTEWLMRIPGVLGTGIGRSAETGRAVLEVYLEEGTGDLARAIPAVLEGIMLERVVTGKIFALSCLASSSSPGATQVGGWQVKEPDVATAIAVQQRHTEWLMQIPGVLGTGIGRSAETGRVVIEVYLEKATAELPQAIPHDLEGVPVKQIVTGKVYAR